MVCPPVGRSYIGRGWDTLEAVALPERNRLGVIPSCCARDGVAVSLLQFPAARALLDRVARVGSSALPAGSGWKRLESVFQELSIDDLNRSAVEAHMPFALQFLEHERQFRAAHACPVSKSFMRDCDPESCFPGGSFAAA